MPAIRFKKKIIIARIRHPWHNFHETEESIEIRRDPLLAYHSRISKTKGLDKVPADEPLKEYVSQAKSCFFCKGKVEEQTPKLPERIDSVGRISHGEALLFPNLSGFATYSAVCIFSKDHFIAIAQFTPTHFYHAILACQEYFQKCGRFHRSPLYPSINGNYLLPAGSSILHPHLQPFLDTYPTNFHRQILRASQNYFRKNKRSFWKDFIRTERNKERFLFETPHVFVYTPFSPLGFYEINAIIGEGENIAELNQEIIREIAEVIYTILQFYHRVQHNSFNLTLFSPPLHFKNSVAMPCLLKMCTRPVFTSFYRNDVTFFEKFHQECMIDKTPEEVAAEFKNLKSGN